MEIGKLRSPQGERLAGGGLFPVGQTDDYWEKRSDYGRESLMSLVRHETMSLSAKYDGEVISGRMMVQGTEIVIGEMKRLGCWDVE